MTTQTFFLAGQSHCLWCCCGGGRGSSYWVSETKKGHLQLSHTACQNRNWASRRGLHLILQVSWKRLSLMRASPHSHAENVVSTEILEQKLPSSQPMASTWSWPCQSNMGACGLLNIPHFLAAPPWARCFSVSLQLVGHSVVSRSLPGEEAGPPHGKG